MLIELKQIKTYKLVPKAEDYILLKVENIIMN